VVVVVISHNLLMEVEEVEEQEKKQMVEFLMDLE
jgi:hypothetical protein